MDDIPVFLYFDDEATDEDYNPHAYDSDGGTVPQVGDVIEWGGQWGCPVYVVTSRRWLYEDLEGGPTSAHLQCQRSPHLEEPAADPSEP